MRYIFGIKYSHKLKTAGRTRIIELFYHELSSPAEWIDYRGVFDGKKYEKLNFFDFCKKLYKIARSECVVEIYNNHFFYILTLRIVFSKAQLRWHYVEYRSGFDYSWFQIYQLINAKLVDSLTYLIVDECVAITYELAALQPFKSIHVVPPLYARKTNSILAKSDNTMVFAVGLGYQSQLNWFLRIVKMNPSWSFSLITTMSIDEEFTNLSLFYALSDHEYEVLLCRQKYGLVVMETNQKDFFRYPNKIGEYVNCGLVPLVTCPNPSVLRDLGEEVVFDGLDCSFIATSFSVDWSRNYSWETYQDILK